MNNNKITVTNNIYDKYKRIYSEDGIEVWDINIKYLAIDRSNYNAIYFYELKQMNDTIKELTEKRLRLFKNGRY